MGFKTNNKGAAFQDPRDDTKEERLLAIQKRSFTPDTGAGNLARGQLAHYAGAQHSLQSRHFSLSVVVQGDHARFLPCDPSATVVTTAFNYRTNPELLAESLWRFDHLSPGKRGHDVSIQLSNPSPEVDTRVREKLGIKDNDILLYKYEVPGLIGTGYAYGPRPPTQNRSLVNQCTRSLPVVWIPTEDVSNSTRSWGELGELGDPGTGEDKVIEKGLWSEEGMIYMKVTWRFLSGSPDAEVLPEHKIYDILHPIRPPTSQNMSLVVTSTTGGRKCKSWWMHHGSVCGRGSRHINTTDSCMGL